MIFSRKPVATFRNHALAPGAEEALEQLRGLGFPDAAIDLGPVQAGRCGEKAHPALDPAALGIGGAAWRSATISAWAVGSRSASVRLPAWAIRSPSQVITQPMGTSPAAAAACA